ncbi:GIY-YIG nuclease family protein [Massilia sp. CCM 8734]|nr:GIY-YIG nuclease family protein [Massilia sp. CCM 8734]
MENTADEVSYRPASNALAVHETFRLVPGAAQEVNLPDEEIETESLEKLEAGIGRLYVLGTSLYTKGGEEIVKIGITTGTVENRISQLYTTGVPFRFRVMKDIETKNYYELEQSLHKLLDPYRINRSREFFTEKCLPFVDKVVAIHNEIHSGLQEG